MADVFTREKRSEVMSKIRGRGNLSTEMRMIALMRLHGLKGWRRHYCLPGSPDFIFMERKLAVFVDGCFWHGCPAHYTEPITARKFWRTKVITNRRRDRRVDRQLRSKGWHVLRVWEHDLTKKKSAAMIKRLKRALAK